MNIALLASLLITTSTRYADVTPISSSVKLQTVNELIRAMNEDYFSASLSKQVETALRAKLASNAYDAITDGTAFAKTLTEDMRALCHDAHLHVTFSADTLPVRAERKTPSAEEIAKGKHMDRFMNGAFSSVQRLPGNIGYIKFDGFLDPAVAAEPARAAMDFVANTDALIFDIRGNGGGDPATVRLLCSYLFDSKPVHLNDIYFDRGTHKEEFWTLKSVPGKRYLNREVYVLTGPRTGSGAEEFAYDLQNLHRATIVGGSTWGGANPGGSERLNDHFTAFIPVGQAMNPYSKKNWEGTGVIPDVKVDPAEALNEAQRLALRHLLAKTADADDRERYQRALDAVKG